MLKILLLLILATVGGAACATDQKCQGPAVDEWFKRPDCLFGHDVKIVLKGLASVPEKFNYETGAAYEQRIAGSLSKPLPNKVSLSDPMAFGSLLGVQLPTSKFIWAFDPEANSLSIQFAEAEGVYPADGFKAFRFDSDSVAGQSYPAQNAFGARALVRRYQAHETYIAMKPKHFKKVFLAAVNPKDKPHLSLMAVTIVGRIAKPYLTSDQFEITPTFASPKHIHIKQQVIYFEPTDLILRGPFSAEPVRLEF